MVKAEQRIQVHERFMILAQGMGKAAVADSKAGICFKEMCQQGEEVGEGTRVCCRVV